MTGYHEVTVPATSETAKNSTSFLRRPAGRADFVRGAAGFFPFAPGGLEGVEALAEMEVGVQGAGPTRSGGKQTGLDRIINFGAEGGLLEIPPGFTRGMRAPDAQRVDTQNEEETQKILDEEPSAQDNPAVNGDGGSNALASGATCGSA